MAIDNGRNNQSAHPLRLEFSRLRAFARGRHFTSDQLIRARFAPRGLILIRTISLSVLASLRAG